MHQNTCKETNPTIIKKKWKLYQTELSPSVKSNRVERGGTQETVQTRNEVNVNKIRAAPGKRKSPFRRRVRGRTGAGVARAGPRLQPGHRWAIRQAEYLNGRLDLPPTAPTSSTPSPSLQSYRPGQKKSGFVFIFTSVFHLKFPMDTPIPFQGFKSSTIWRLFSWPDRFSNTPRFHKMEYIQWISWRNRVLHADQLIHSQYQILEDKVAFVQDEIQLCYASLF